MLVWREKKALLLKTKTPEQILNVVPNAKSFMVKGDTVVAVPHKITETKLLRNLGFPAPAPIRSYYKWSGRYTPFHAQKEAAAFLSMNKRAFNLSELGTGKSLASLWAYDYLKSVGRLNKALVISPLSTLERTWADELFNHFPHLSFGVLHGTKSKRLKLLAHDFDVYIINHDGVGIIEPHLKARTDIDLVIVDEVAQCARNAGTNQMESHQHGS